DKNIDIGHRRPAGLLDRREDVRLFELFLMIVLAKIAEQQRRAAEYVRINVGRFRSQLHGGFPIDEDGTTNDAMLAHQVFDRADLLFAVFVCFSAARTTRELAPVSTSPAPAARTKRRRVLSNSIIGVSFCDGGSSLSHEAIQVAGSSSNSSPNNSRT